MTSAFVGDATGVANDMFEPIATKIKKTNGLASSVNAAFNAMGANNTAVAVLLMNWPNSIVIK